MVLDQINPALELGRSFIRSEWQRNYAPLALLWKGIGRFVAQRPQYRILYGPVSVSDDYHTLSRRLMVEFLKTNRLIAELAEQVKPWRPVRLLKRGLSRDIELPYLKDIDGLSNLIAFIEGHKRDVPVLLRHYLKLGGRVMGFNVDKQFGNCIDALIVVDLLAADPRILQRYMGSSGIDGFLSYHGQGRPDQGTRLPIAV
jgi:putative hemolysin